MKLLLTATEAAEALSISQRTLFTLTKNGDIRAVPVGKRGVRYAVADLEKFVGRAADKTVVLS